MKIARWVKTGETVGLPFSSLPAYAAIPIAPCLVYARTSTIVITVICTVFIGVISKKGYTLGWVINRLRGRLHGGRISARGIWVIRRFSHTSDPCREAPRLRDS